MRASSLIVLFGFLGFTVSCAHKPAGVETAKTDQAKVEAEKKTDKKEEAKDKEIAYTCLVGKDKRVVTLDKEDKQKRCEVHYTKFGDRQQVAWAESTPDICDKAFNNIRENIEGSGYQCLDGLNAKFEEPKKDGVKKEQKEELKEEKKTEAKAEARDTATAIK